MTSPNQEGRLLGLGPDSVGFIAVGEDRKPMGFILENLGIEGSFADLGWKDGQRVTFRTDSRGIIRKVTPSPKPGSHREI